MRLSINLRTNLDLNSEDSTTLRSWSNMLTEVQHIPSKGDKVRLAVGYVRVCAITYMLKGTVEVEVTMPEGWSPNDFNNK